MDDIEIIDDQFKVLKPLGKGYTAEVLLAEHVESQTKLAIKIYKPTGNVRVQEKAFANEVNTMRNVNNPNVLKILAGNNAGVYKRPGKIEKSIMYMGVELCAGGEFFDYIADPGKGFCENTARYYFKQLITGLKGIHDTGIAHRDLKTENLFVDGEMNIKIGDFGFAKFTEQEKGGLLKTALGTPGYQCPELLEGDNYSGTGNDVFACGVILFIMYCGFPPFREAKKFDPWYRHFYNKNPAMFWSMHTKQKRTPPISESFKDLINGMLACKDRYTVDDIVNSTWVNEKEIDVEALKTDMEERRKIVMSNRSKQEEQMDVDDGGEGAEKVYRGGDDEKEALENFTNKFEELEFDSVEANKWNNSDYNKDFLRFRLTPKNLLKNICSKLILKYPGIKVDIEEKSYRANVSYTPKITEENLETVEDIDSLPYELDFEFEILAEDEDNCVVQFNKKETMPQYDFKNFYNGFRTSYEEELGA